MTGIYEAIINDNAVWVNGRGFHVFNYGNVYSEAFNNGFRRIGLVSDRVSYMTRTFEEEFPQGVVFEKREPYMALTEVGHASTCARGIITVNIDLELEEAIKILKGRGMRFEE
ncbi:hypothetical protein KAR91_55445 [Candidatus Pacearchaeota archaeon]|nr:hypothetical protein [Candidatus Pacearchaeota archaeon]